MTVILGRGDIVEQMSAADKGNACTFCDKPLTIPYMSWLCSSETIKTLFICGQCCEWIARGFSLDLRNAATALKLKRMGFHEGMKKAAISGGFLYTSGANDKH
jgi:hypothetical protein